MQKWPLLDQNHELPPLEKSQFFNVFNFLFLQPKKTSLVLKYRKTHFLACIAKNKKKEKWPILYINHGQTPWKNLNFSTFLTSCFYGLKRRFSFQNIVKHIFLASIAKNKNMKKWPILDQNHGLTPLGKSQFFNFLNFLFLQNKKTFFRSKIS